MAPYDAKKQPDSKLPRKAFGRKTTETLVHPISGRSRRYSNSRLHARKQQHDACDRHDHDAGAAEYAAVNPQRESDGGDENSDSCERERQATSEHYRSETMLSYRGAKNNGQQGHDTR